MRARRRPSGRPGWRRCLEAGVGTTNRPLSPGRNVDQHDDRDTGRGPRLNGETRTIRRPAGSSNVAVEGRCPGTEPLSSSVERDGQAGVTVGACHERAPIRRPGWRTQARRRRLEGQAERGQQIGGQVGDGQQGPVGAAVDVEDAERVVARTALVALAVRRVDQGASVWRPGRVEAIGQLAVSPSSDLDEPDLLRLGRDRRSGAGPTSVAGNRRHGLRAGTRRRHARAAGSPSGVVARRQ